MINVEKIRKEFPALDQKINGKMLIYLDNAATTLKPRIVINALTSHYSRDTANIHRGIHLLSQRATEKYEEARECVKEFINASNSKEIIFTKGTTDSINLVAYSYGSFLKRGDEIIISEMEHHSNIVPWQLLCERTGAKLKIIPINKSGELIIEDFKKILGPKTKIVSVAHISNALGTINPVKEIAKIAHKFGAVVLIDGAQAVAHIKVDVRDIDCDFYAFSGHKMFGPTGVGVLYGRRELLEKMPPFEGGGDMIESVKFDKTTYNELPYKFEAGTPPIAEVIALKSAIDYINKIGIDEMKRYEEELLEYATEKLGRIKELKIIGNAKNKSGIISFTLDDIHPHDTGSFCDQDGIAIRTGHHCAQPVMDYFGVCATARVSFSIYNTKEEIDELIKSVRKVVKLFKGINKKSEGEL